MSCISLTDQTVKQKSKNELYFLREHEGMTYREAVETLCKFVGMEVSHVAKGNGVYARKHKALELTVKFYEDHLSESSYLKD